MQGLVGPRPLDACLPTNIMNCSYPLGKRVSLDVGLQWSGTVIWVLCGSSDVHHLLSPVIKLGIRHPRKKENERGGGKWTTRRGGRGRIQALPILHFYTHSSLLQFRILLCLININKVPLPHTHQMVLYDT